MVGIALHVEFNKRDNHNSMNRLPGEALYSSSKIKVQNPRLVTGGSANTQLLL